MRGRTVAALVAAGALVAVPAAAAGAAGVAVPVGDDGRTVVEVSESDGAWTGSLELTNAGDADVRLEVSGAGALAGCTDVRVSPPTLAAHRVVPLTVTTTCEVPDQDAVVALGLGDDADTVQVALEPAAADQPGWWWLLAVLGVAAALALAPVLVLRDAWRGLRVQSVDAAGAPRWQDPDGAAPREPVTEPVDASTPVVGAPTGWSFSDSWASNFTAVLALLTALFGSADMLGALLGTAPEGAEGRLLVTAAAAALLVGVAPLALRLVGPTSTPTVGGIALGAWLTLTGTFLQVLALVHVLGDGPLATPVVVLAFAVVLFLLGYAVRTLLQLFTEAFPTPPAEVPTAVSELVLLAAAVAGPHAAVTVAERLAASEEGARAYLDEVAGAPTAPGTAGSLPGLPPGPRPAYPPAVLGTSPGDLPSAIL